MASLTWSHTESDTQTTLPKALEAAKTGAWAALDPPTRARYLRMLVVLSLQAGTMKNAMPRPAGPEGRIEYGAYAAAQYRDRISLEIASTVLRTLQLIVPPGRYTVQSIRTEDGGAPFLLPGQPQEVEVGALPLVVWIAGVAACTIAAVLIGKVAGDVVDRQLTRSEDTKKLVSSQAAAVEVVLKHAEREEKAGQSLPWDEAELMTIESLLKTQRRIAEKRETPLPTPFSGAAKSLDNAMGSVGRGLGMAVPLVIAGGILFFIWSRE